MVPPSQGTSWCGPKPLETCPKAFMVITWRLKLNFPLVPELISSMPILRVFQSVRFSEEAGNGPSFTSYDWVGVDLDPGDYAISAILYYGPAGAADLTYTDGPVFALGFKVRTPRPGK